MSNFLQKKNIIISLDFFLCNYCIKNKYLPNTINNNLILIQTECINTLNSLLGTTHEIIIFYIRQHKNLFIKMLFHEKYLLDAFPLAILYLNFISTKWVEDKINYPEKNFEISFLTTGKTYTDMHKLRVSLWNNMHNVTIPKKLYNSNNYKDNSILKKYDDSVNMENNTKNFCYDTSMFALVIDHKHENYITEKLNDVLICKCVPVFYGCKNIDSFYNTKGFIIIDGDIDNIINTINKITPDDYYSRLEFIEENYLKVNEFYKNKNKKYLSGNAYFDNLLGRNNYTKLGLI